MQQHEQDRIEVRMLAALLTLAFVISLAEPVFYLLAVPQSVIAEVAGVAPSVWCVIAAFGLCLLATLPHLVWLVLRPARLGDRWPRAWAAGGALGAAATWIYLANLSLPLDLGGVEWAYGMRAIGSLVMGLTYGISLNAQQIRETADATHL
ncbi:hypothetical protein [Paracidovorax wautersii]|uniref:Uncharacterized protein n=1 Tax=Paracidovorax wautersii TaxID=1177982 RepID=A0A1I2FK75_9BURK|nr:hypothetical protein [Paracidovorax wautersii]SFF05117.1 hypothetical protein SAMN04489711_1114 [Paracidovorax wautersii]